MIAVRNLRYFLLRMMVYDEVSFIAMECVIYFYTLIFIFLHNFLRNLLQVCMFMRYNTRWYIYAKGASE